MAEPQLPGGDRISPLLQRSPRHRGGERCFPAASSLGSDGAMWKAGLEIKFSDDNV